MPNLMYLSTITSLAGDDSPRPRPRSRLGVCTQAETREKLAWFDAQRAVLEELQRRLRACRLNGERCRLTIVRRLVGGWVGGWMYASIQSQARIVHC